MKDTTDKVGSASFLDIPVEIDSGGRLRTKLWQEMISIFALQTFNYNVCVAALVYGVDISQLIRYSRACGSYHNFRDTR